MKNGAIRKKSGMSKSFDKRDRSSSRKSFGGFGDKPKGRRKDFSRFDAEKISHKITCAECGAIDTVPFKPMSDKPVLCRECFGKDDRHEAKGRSYKGRDSKSFGSKSRPRRDFDRADSRSSERPRREFARPDFNTKQIEELHKKLDKILALLDTE